MIGIFMLFSCETIPMSDSFDIKTSGRNDLDDPLKCIVSMNATRKSLHNIEINVLTQNNVIGITVIFMAVLYVIREEDLINF